MCQSQSGRSKRLVVEYFFILQVKMRYRESENLFVNTSFMNFCCNDIKGKQLYHKTRILSNHKCQKIHLDFTYNLSKASIFDTVKNYWYPDNLAYLYQGSHMYPSRHLTSLACPCCPPIHYVRKMCGDFRQHPRFLGNYMES